jgi:hypothetical protein
MQPLGFLGHLSRPGIREHLMYSVSQSEFPFRFSYANMPGVTVAGTRSVQRKNEFCPDRIRPVFSHLAGAKRISGKRVPKVKPNTARNNEIAPNAYPHKDSPERGNE